jgi:hypothetical protein
MDKVYTVANQDQRMCLCHTTYIPWPQVGCRYQRHIGGNDRR